MNKRRNKKQIPHSIKFHWLIIIAIILTAISVYIKHFYMELFNG